MIDRLQRLFSEWQRRRVTRVAMVYVVAALGVLQAAQLILPELAPGWVYTTLVIAAIAGLPIAIILAWVFDVTPTGIERTPGWVNVDAAAAPPVSRNRRIVMSLATLTVLILGWVGWRAVHRAEEPNNDVIAVLPFRVSGPDTYRYLREGLVDLVNARLSDKPRAVDARTLFAAWRRAAPDSATDLGEREAINVARGLGAGRVLLGTVIATGNRLTLTARLVNLKGKAFESGPIEGPADSIPMLVDRLVAAVLSLDAGESPATVAALTTTSLPALRAYLEGKALDRRAMYAQAVQRYNEALSIDSTFALAAFNVTEAADMLLGSAVQPFPRASQLAWAFKERLSPADRLYLEAKRSASSGSQSAIDKWEAAVQALPDRPEAWYHLGDILYHNGAYAGHEDYETRAEAAFNRAIELDSTYVTPLLHLGFIAFDRVDTLSLRRIAGRLDESGAGGGVIRGMLIEAIGDSARLAERTAALDTASAEALTIASLFWQFEPRNELSLKGAELAAGRMRQTARTAQERASANTSSARLALNEGRPTAALKFRNDAQFPPAQVRRTIILDALYWDGDKAAAVAAAASPTPDPVPGDTASLNAQTQDVCINAQWKLAQNDVAGTDLIVRRLRAVQSPQPRVVTSARVCAALIDAAAATISHRSDAAAKSLALDSILRPAPSGMPLYANLAAARLLEQNGRPAEALGAARRMLKNEGGEVYRAEYFETRARLAAQQGMREEAIKYYGHYLTIRYNPEPSLVARRDAARAALDRLMKDR
ncbi:MAG: hypothetical protein ABIV28_07185 [Longimicrobiales bacterium]